MLKINDAGKRPLLAENDDAIFGIKEMMEILFPYPGHTSVMFCMGEKKCGANSMVSYDNGGKRSRQNEVLKRSFTNY